MVDEIAAAGGTAAPSGFDVADPAAVTDAIEAAIGKDHGGLDILVNNAGVAINGLLLRFSDDQWAKVIATNLSGAFRCTRTAASLVMRAKTAGRIINVTSVVGEQGNGGQAAYSASKAGIIGLTLSTAREASRRAASRATRCRPGTSTTDDDRRAPARRPRAPSSSSRSRSVGSAAPRTSPARSRSSPAPMPATSPARCSASTAGC